LGSATSKRLKNTAVDATVLITRCSGNNPNPIHETLKRKKKNNKKKNEKFS
jgi:hypothetical protein